jgi:molybdate transport system substrate-binding protein
MEDLLRDAVRVALPNPELAAAGRAAKRALRGTGQWEAIEKRIGGGGAKVSQVGKVTEAAQAVKIGSADAAIVWDATARQFGLTIVEVSVFQQQPETALIGVVAASAKPTAALHFARYLAASDRGEPVLREHHFQPIEDADVWEDRPALNLMSGAMLKPAVDELLKGFQKREGVDINTIYAGCGIHVAQMKAIKSQQNPGKQFPDAYFACDVSFMDQVQQWFEAARKISRNDMVLLVARGNPKGVKSIDDLARPELRVGLAHPVNSALGALTDDLLKKLGLHGKVYDPSRKHAVVHSDAGHMLVNEIRTGALDLIVVYRSNFLSAGENPAKQLELIEMNIPQAVAIQPYAVAKDTHHKYLMRRLLEAILTPESQKRFTGVGFQWVAEEQGR